MASLYDMTVGQDIELKRVLAKAGLDADMIEAVIKKPALAQEWVAFLRGRMRPALPSLFNSVDYVLTQFAERAKERTWFSTREVGELRRKCEGHMNFRSTLSRAFNLDIWLGSVSRTISELWLWDEEVFGLHTDKSPELDFGQVHHAFPGRYGDKPSVRPISVDLAAHQGCTPRVVRDSYSAGLSLMTALAVHPAYTKVINGDTIPNVWMAGLRYVGGDLEGTPMLTWLPESQFLRLGLGSVDIAYPNFAVPKFENLQY